MAKTEPKKIPNTIEEIKEDKIGGEKPNAKALKGREFSLPWVGSGLMASMGGRQGLRLQSPQLPWTRCFQKGLWVSVQSRGPFSLQRLVSHCGHLGLEQEPGQALPAEVVTHALTRVLLPKPEQGQVQLQVDVLAEGVGHRCLGLGVMQAQRADLPSVVASNQLARCL